MIHHNLVQGTPEWHAHRAKYFNASDAPAMMGVSPYKTRAELLHELATGIVPEVDPRTQALFDKGHRFEKLARPLAEAIIGEELYPVVGTEGKLGASFDGLPMLEDQAFEHKMLNKALREAMTPGCTGDALPMVYQIQNEQQCMVSGATRVLFMATNWDDDDNLLEERHCWYESNPELAEGIRAGWDQFDLDLCAYVPESVEVKPLGRTRENLPALHVELSGRVTASNLAEYKAHALEVFSSINTELKTDQDFADATETVSWCEDVEKRIVAAKDHALSQTASIDELFRTLDFIAAEARRVRLNLSNKVEKEKVVRRTEVVTNAQQALDEHIKALNVKLGHQWIARRVGPFGDAIKGKKSLATCREAADTALASEKVAANLLSERLAKNWASLSIDNKDWAFLFADFATVGTKDVEDFKAISTLRIQQHETAEAARIKREDEQKVRAAVAAIRFPDPEPVAAAPVAPAVIEAAIAQPAIEPPAPQPLAPALVPSSFPVTTGGYSSTVTTTLITTMVLGEYLGLEVKADLITSLGFTSIKQTKPGTYWRESEVPAIRAALAKHILEHRRATAPATKSTTQQPERTVA